MLKILKVNPLLKKVEQKKETVKNKVIKSKLGLLKN
jgi:hypothetical protein